MVLRVTSLEGGVIVIATSAVVNAFAINHGSITRPITIEVLTLIFSPVNVRYLLYDQLRLASKRGMPMVLESAVLNRGAA